MIQWIIKTGETYLQMDGSFTNVKRTAALYQYKWAAQLRAEQFNAEIIRVHYDVYNGITEA